MRCRVVARDTQVSIESTYSVSFSKDSLTAASTHIFDFLLQKVVTLYREVLQQSAENEKISHLYGVDVRVCLL